MGGGARRVGLPAPLGGQGLLCFERAVCLVLAHLQAEAPARQDWASGAFDLDDGVAALAPTGAPDLDDWLWTMWVERRPHTTRTRPCRGPDRAGRPGGRLDHDLRAPRPSLAAVGAAPGALPSGTFARVAGGGHDSRLCRRRPLVEGTELSRTLAGFAHMVALDTAATTFDLTDRWAGNCRVRPRRPALLAGLGPLR